MISIIGAGRVGANAAFQLAKEGLDSIKLVDIVAGLPQGEALDLMQCSDFRVDVSGTNDYSEIKGSKVVVIVAGMPRKPGMTRLDLAKTNSAIVRSICGEIKKHAPGAAVIIITNPMDVMVWVAAKELGFPRGKVMGMGGQLDSQRFAYFLSRELNVAPADVRAMVIGEHGDSMVPLPSQSLVRGEPVAKRLSGEQIGMAIEKTRIGGAEIIKMKGGTSWAPASAVAKMVKAILRDEKAVLPASFPLEGEYGQSGLSIGVPVVLGRNGVERIVDLKLDSAEMEQFRKSCEAVKGAISEL